VNYFRGLALNLDPPDLCLLSSWDYSAWHLTWFLPGFAPYKIPVTYCRFFVINSVFGGHLEGMHVSCFSLAFVTVFIIG
jgi:hypothetical protein